MTTMKQFNLLTVALGVGSLARGVLAQECQTNSVVDAETGEAILRVTSPDQLDEFRNGCTTLAGHIVIDAAYSGDFILNEITGFTGNISMDPESGLGNFEMLNLMNIDALHLSPPGDVHLPKLEHAGDIFLLQRTESGEVDLGALVDALNLQLEGSWTSIKLGSLKTVEYRLQICAIEGCAIMPDLNPPALAVDLPVLEAANYFEVAGTIKSVSIPLLERVGYHSEDYRGFRVNTQGPELEVTAPKLSTLEGELEVYGTVTSLKLGALGQTNLGGWLNTDSALYFYSTLETAAYIYFWGNFKGIYLPNLDHLGAVDMPTDHKLPCTKTVVKLWEPIPIYDAGDTYAKYKCYKVTVSEEELYPEDSPSHEDEDTSNDDTNHETPDTSDETPDTSDETPDTSDETPDTSDETPDTSDETPDTPNETPDTPNETPDTNDETSHTTDETSDTSDETPDTDTAPDTSDKTPDTSSNSTDTTSNSGPSNTETGGPVFTGAGYQPLPHAGKVTMVVVAVISACYF